MKTNLIETEIGYVEYKEGMDLGQSKPAFKTIDGFYNRNGMLVTADKAVIQVHTPSTFQAGRELAKQSGNSATPPQVRSRPTPNSDWGAWLPLI